MIGSHIIPKFYLEQFATPSKRGKNKPGRIWVYEKNKEPQERGTSVQGVENGYFGLVRSDGSLEESFETYLANREKECNDILICAKSDLFDWTSTHYRNKLAFYASLLYSRATQRREFTAMNWARIQKQLAELIDDDKYVRDLTDHYQKKFPNQNVSIVAIRNRMRGLLAETQTKSATKNVFLNDLLFIAEFIQNVLLEKPWQVWKAPSGAEFITSDNPLITFIPVGNGELNPGHGFRKPGVITAFPLAPNACLAMGAQGSEFRTLTALQLSRVNETIVRLCDRFVYSKTQSDEIKKMVDEHAGATKYGVNAFLPIGLHLPSVREYMRRHIGLPPEE